MRRSQFEIAPGTLAWVARDVNARFRESADFIAKNSCVLVLGRAFKPPEPMVSSVSYVILRGNPSRIDCLAHCDLLIEMKVRSSDGEPSSLLPVQ